jgi:DNA anti-recombination protein RmuC
LNGEALAIIIAASIGAIGTVMAGILSLTASIRQMREENTIDHGVVQERLQSLRTDVAEVKDDVKSVGSRLESHVEWHVKNPIKD